MREPSDAMQRSSMGPDGTGIATRWILRITFYGTAAVLCMGMLWISQREVVGGLAVAFMLLLIAMRLPVGAAMAIAGSIGLFSLAGTSAVVSTWETVPFNTVNSWSLTVLPLFIFMGFMLWKSGATTLLYRAAKLWLSWLPGGLAVATNFAGAGLGAVSGSTLGVAYSLGRIGIPEMLKEGYDPRLATGSILMAGTGGQLIPPSILLVVYAGIAAVPVGPQLIAGILPGVVLALLFGLLIVILCLINPGLGGRVGVKSGEGATVSFRERVSSLSGVWPLAAIAIGVVGGLYGGVFTPTEAGAFGAAGAIIVSLWLIGVKQIVPTLFAALGDTVATTGSIFFLLIGSFILNRLIVVSGLARWVTIWLEGLGLGRVSFLLLLLLVFLFLGMFMDPLTMMLVTVPLLLPILEAMDVSRIWFGVFVVLLGELAIVTPPVGILTFVIHGMTKNPDVNLGRDIALGDVFRGVLWFVPVAVMVLGLLIAWPSLALWHL